jgi:hypothetical protein
VDGPRTAPVWAAVSKNDGASPDSRRLDSSATKGNKEHIGSRGGRWRIGQEGRRDGARKLELRPKGTSRSGTAQSFRGHRPSGAQEEGRMPEEWSLEAGGRTPLESGIRTGVNWRETEESANLEKPFIGASPPPSKISTVVVLVLHVPLSRSHLTLQTWLSRKQLRCPSSRPTGKSFSASRCYQWLIILPATAWTTMRVATKLTTST